MEKQIIVSVSREYGSGGHKIAEKIAQDLGISFYDRNLLDEIAKEKNASADELKSNDEKPRNRLLSRRVNGYSSSMEDNVAEMQFEYLEKKAESGESFVVVGRCSETVLKDYEGLVSIFVTGGKEAKLARIMREYKLEREEAAAKIERHDRLRRKYHNHYSDFKWGDSRNYDVCINANRLGIDGTAKLLEQYILGESK